MDKILVIYDALFLADKNIVEKRWLKLLTTFSTEEKIMLVTIEFGLTLFFFCMDVSSLIT